MNYISATFNVYLSALSLTTPSLSAVIIQSLKDTPPLTDDSVIFTSDRVAIGKVGGPAGAVCMNIFTSVYLAFLQVLTYLFVCILLVL